MLESIYAPSARGASQVEPGRQWWNEAPGDAWGYMLARAAKIAADQKETREDMRMFASFYAGRRLSSLYYFDADKAPSSTWDYMGHRLTWNVIAVAIRSAASRLAKSRVRPRIQTFDGDWKSFKKGEKLGHWLDGLFHEQNYYQRVARPCFGDAEVFHGGIPKVLATRDGIEIERMLPFELLIDDGEGMHRRPHNAYHAAVLPRDKVEEAFGTDEAKRELIRSTSCAPDSEHRGDVIEVVEGWHVGARGRHIVAVAAGPLVDEGWKLARMPFGRLVYEERPVGWWGIGIAERLVGHQLEITRTLAAIQSHLRKNAGGRWWAPIGSNIGENDLINRQGALVISSQKPEPLIVPFMPPEVYAHLERTWRNALETVGLSEQSVTGMKPGGLNSGKALREQRDTEQEGFSLPAQAFDELTTDVADLCIDTARLHFAGNKSATVRAPGTRLVQRIEWGDVDMRKEDYILRSGAANLLPTTPAARLEAIQEMEARGTIGHEAAAALLNMPDVEGAVAPGAAQYEEAVRAVSALLDGEAYEAPDECLRPDLAITIAETLYLRAKSAGAPGQKLACVLRWRDDNKARLRELAAAALPPPGQPMPPAPIPAPPVPGLPVGPGIPPAA